MRKRIYLLFTILCISGVLAAQDVKEILILHTNDTHSRIEPVSTADPDKRYAGKAGFVRRVTLVNEMREKHKDLLLFDCGDFSQGSPYYNLFEGTVEVKLMNEMGYDAGIMGNHEFDLGLENLARLLKMANFPTLCANYKVEGTPLEGLVKPYLIFNRDGVKIGVFGISPRLEGLVQEKNFEGIGFENPEEAAQRVASFLKKKKKCDLIICLSHLGWKGPGFSDEKLIAATRHIDIVLGGHSHSLFKKSMLYKNAAGKEVVLQQMGKNGAYMGEMRVKMKKKE